MTEATDARKPPARLVPARLAAAGATLKKLDAGALSALALVAVGVWLRLWGYFDMGFWNDESNWASRMFEGQATEIRPPGYVALSQWLGTLHNSEPVLRLPSLLAGVATLPVWLVVCKRFGFARWSGLAGLLILTLHRATVTLSKEFKPYALELFLHLALMALTLAFLQKRDRRLLWGLGLLGAFSPLFAWSVALLLPWVFGIVFVDCLRRKERASSILSFAAGALTAGVLLGIFLYKLQGADAKTDYWGKKYDVFFLGEGALAHAEWLASKSWATLTNTARLMFLEPIAQPVYRVARGLHGALGVVGGLSILWRRQYLRALLLFGPWFFALVLAALGKWPYGPFRTNLFVLGYALLLMVAGLQEAGALAAKWPATKRIGQAVLAAYALAALPIPVSRAAGKTMWGQQASVREAMLIIQEKQAEWDRRRAAQSPDGKKPPRPVLLMDGAGCAGFEYYSRHYAGAKPEGLTRMRQTTRRKCLHYDFRFVKREIQRMKSRRYWVMTATTRFRDKLLKLAKRRCANLDVERVLPGKTVLLHCAGGSKPKPPPR